MPHLSKPLSEFFTLDKKLSLQGTRFSLKSGESFSPSTINMNDATIVLQNGAASLYRKNNNNLHDIVHGPSILGLAAAINNIHNDYTLVAEIDCRGYYLSAKETLVCLERYQLWKDAFYWMTWQTRMLELRDQQLIGVSHYQQIRSTLLMMLNWDENIRSKIGVLHYIQQRTRISRSVIAEVLSALRQGDYIKMEKGKLVGITRLPYDY